MTKPGVVAGTGEVAADGSYVKVRPHGGPEVPVVLRIQVSGTVSGGHITARPPRRTSWPWLRRHPQPTGLPHRDPAAMTDPGPLPGQRARSSKAANDDRSPASHRPSPSPSPNRRKEPIGAASSILLRHWPPRPNGSFWCQAGSHDRRQQL